MKPKMVVVFLMSLIVFLISSCGHHKDVRPNADGNHFVKLLAETPESGLEEARSQAKHYCDSKDKEMSVVEEKHQYAGDMDEKNYKAVKTAGKVAQEVGGSMFVFGKKESTNDKGRTILHGGSTLGNIAGEGYQVEMKFKCF
jgi:hypothetical protein